MQIHILTKKKKRKSIKKDLDIVVKMANKSIYNANHNGMPSVKRVIQVLLYKCHISQLHKTMLYAFFWVIPPASEFYMPMFRNILFHLHRRVGMKNDWV